jgi:hypothetical protein
MMSKYPLCVSKSLFMRRSCFAHTFTKIRFQSSYGSSSGFFSPPRPSSSSSAQHVELSGVEFSKPDGSIQVRFRPPKFAPARAPPVGGAQLYRPALEGIITLRLTPAASVSNNSDGRVSYDWDASMQINLGVLEILHVVQNSIAASVNVQEAPPRGQQQQQQQQQRMRLEILPPTSIGTPTTGSPSLTNNVTHGGNGGGGGGGGGNQYRISILSEEGKGVSVSVSQAEVYLLRNLLGTSLPWVTGWMYNLDPSALIPGYHLLPPYQQSAANPQQPQPQTQQSGYNSPPPPPPSPQPSQSQQPRTSAAIGGSALPSYAGRPPYNATSTSRSPQQPSSSSSTSSYSRPPYPPRNS